MVDPEVYSPTTLRNTFYKPLVEKV